MTNRDVCFGFVAGIIAGSAIAMLYAPQSGADTRRRIRETSRDAGLKVRGTFDDVKGGLDRTMSEAASKVASGADRVAAAVDRGREALRTAVASA